jgi:acetolactate synthase I/II/III large subunit
MQDGKTSIDRRGFLKGATAGAAGLVAQNAFAGAQAPAQAPQGGTAGSNESAPAPASPAVNDRPASDFMVDVFKSLGIEYAMAMPAGNFAGIIESVVHYGGNRNPEWLTCMNEESSVEMAIGYAKIEGKPALVCAHATVGLQHAAMGIYDAWCDRVPVYMMLGNTQDSAERNDPVTWVHSANDPCSLVRDMTKWDDNPISMVGWAEAAVRAYRIAMTPPYGPTAVVIDEHRHVSNIPATFRVPSFTMPAAPQGSIEAVREAAQLLVAAQNPVIITGMHARTPAGIALLVELAETLQAGVIDRKRRMNFPTRHPLNGGQAAQADVVLALEAGYITGDARAARQRNAKFISISTNELFLKSNYGDQYRFAEIDLPITGDAEATLPTLIEEVKKLVTADRRRVFQERGAKIADANRTAFERAKQEAALGWDASPISTARLSMELWNQIRNEDWSLVTGWVNWPLRLWNMDKHYQYIGRSGGEAIGYHLPASIGAALANRKHGRLTVAIQPDGDFMVANGALWTAAHHRIPLLIVMQNNRAYHQDFMDAQRIALVRNRGSLETMAIGTEITNPNIDYAKLAQSMGVAAEGPISNPNDLAAAIRRGIQVVKRGEPYLIDAVTQPR